MNRDELDRLHADPGHWKYGIFYICQADPRLIVPKRIRGLGWTLNFSRPQALPILIVAPLLLIGIIKLTIYLGASPEVLFAVKTFLLFVVIAVGLRLSKSADAPPPAGPDSNSGNRPEAPNP